jgi:small subunit ribosomal protein S15
MMVEKFGNNPFDTNSPSVKIAILTEKILNLRAHLIVRPKDQHAKGRMAIFLGARTKVMRKLCSSDFPLYQWTCKELGIRCVRFSAPTKDPQFAYNPLAVDGDRAKFLIRQKLWKGKNRPRREPAADGRGSGVVFTKHPIEAPPADHGKPERTPQQINVKWPYGIRKERVQGSYVVDNPTAPGKGYIPASIAW